MDRHTRPYTCHITSCRGLDFGDHGGLLRHQREKHGNVKFFCRIAGCTRNRRGFNRKRNLDAHMATLHTPVDLVAGEVPMSNASNGVLALEDVQKQNTSKRGTLSMSSKSGRLWLGKDNRSVEGYPEGLRESGRMAAKLQELEDRKMELVDLQAKMQANITKTEEDIKTLRKVLELLGAEGVDSLMSGE